VQLQAEVVTSREEFVWRLAAVSFCHLPRRCASCRTWAGFAAVSWRWASLWLGYSNPALKALRGKAAGKNCGVNLQLASAHVVLLIGVSWPYFFVDVWLNWQQGGFCW